MKQQGINHFYGRVLLCGLFGASASLGVSAALAHEGHEHAMASAPGSAAAPASAAARKPRRPELGVSAALDAQGRLWVVGKESSPDGEHVVVRQSSDDGKTWSPGRRVNAQAEPVAAPGEERPRLLFGRNNRMHVLWTRPGSKNYAGDIRLATSGDGGASWSAPLTVQRDTQPISHRHPVMTEDGEGRLYVLWIDRRDVELAKASGEPHPGASLYYAVSDDGGKNWRGDFQLSNASCDCCRLALQTAADGVPEVFWRQVFPGSERDHAFARLTPDGKALAIRRATRDQWQVEACPDHGPALAVTGQARHAVWFDMVPQGGKVFYGRLTGNGSLANGIEGLRMLPDGAEHADVVASGDQVWVAWQRFDGQQNTVGGMVSTDGGNSWREQILATSRGAVDQPRLLVQGKQALLVWNTAEQGLLVRRF